MRASFIVIIFLCIQVYCYGQFYFNAGISLPSKGLSNLTGEGFYTGASYSSAFGNMVELEGSASFIFFQSKHYPENTSIGTPVSWDYRVNMLPILFGGSFHPFKGHYSRRIFLSGKVGGQWIFFNYDNIGVQQSTFYTSKELDFSYCYEAAIDLNRFKFLLSNTSVVSNNNYFVTRINYFSVLASFKIYGHKK